MSFRSGTRVLLFPMVLLAGWGCSSSPRNDPQELVAGYLAFLQNHYQLQSGDRLELLVPGLVEPAVQFTVDPQGSVALPRVGTLLCRGRSLQAFKVELEGLYAKIYAEPRVEVTLLEPAEQVIYVGGEVRNHGGTLPYRPGMTLMRAVLAMGSFDITAKTSAVYLLRQGENGRPLHYRIDLGKIAYEGGMDVPLLPNDAVFVQTNESADVANWVELHIHRMLPIPVGSVAGAYAGTAMAR